MGWLGLRVRRRTPDLAAPRSASRNRMARAAPHPRRRRAGAGRDSVNRTVRACPVTARQRPRPTTARQRARLCRPSYGDIQVRNGDRLVLVPGVPDQAWMPEFDRLQERLTELQSWLPSSAWEDPEIRAYVPSRYAICPYRFPAPLDWSRILPLLPAPAEELLADATPCRWDAPDRCCTCFDVTTEEARAVAEALDDGRNSAVHSRSFPRLPIRCPRSNRRDHRHRLLAVLAGWRPGHHRWMRFRPASDHLASVCRSAGVASVSWAKTHSARPMHGSKTPGRSGARTSSATMGRWPSKSWYDEAMPRASTHGWTGTQRGWRPCRGPTPESPTPHGRRRWVMGDVSATGPRIFGEQLNEQAWRDVLGQWWPRLRPGILAGTTHGVIRVSHVVRALLAGSDDPASVTELGHALAFWAARMQPLPVSASASGRLDSAAALDSMPRVPEQRGPVASRLAQLADLPEWPRVVAAMSAPANADDVPRGLPASLTPPLFATSHMGTQPPCCSCTLQQRRTPSCTVYRHCLRRSGFPASTRCGQRPPSSTAAGRQRNRLRRGCGSRRRLVRMLSPRSSIARFAMATSTSSNSPTLPSRHTSGHRIRACWPRQPGLPP